MGYGYYCLPTPEGRMMRRGYRVPCKCHQRGCGERIDRGLAYLCYYCTQYFCGKHLTTAWDADDRSIEADCFAGVSSQVCGKCAATMEKDAALEARENIGEEEDQ